MSRTATMLSIVAIFCAGLLQCSKDIAKSTFDDALAAGEKGKWYAATELLVAFVDAYEDDEVTPEAYFMLGTGYEKLQQWHNALTTYRVLAKKFPESVFVIRAQARLQEIRVLGKILRDQGNFQGAALVFHALIESFSDDPQYTSWQISLGFCSELAGEWQSAITAYQKFLQDNPESEESDRVRTILAWLEPFSLMMLEDARGAADYTRAIKELRAFREAYPKHPQRADAIFWIAYAYEYNLDSPHMSTARAVYTSFIKQYPQHKYVPQALFQIAHTYQNDLARPNYEKALTLFDTVIISYPGTEWAERALFAKADILEHKLKRYREAIDNYTEVLKPAYRDELRFQKFLYAQVRIGCIYKDALKDTDQARAIFTQILADDPEGWYSGRVYWQLKLMDKADARRM